jgi:hypothetical protein
MAPQGPPHPPRVHCFRDYEQQVVEEDTDWIDDLDAGAQLFFCMVRHYSIARQGKLPQEMTTPDDDRGNNRLRGRDMLDMFRTIIYIDENFGERIRASHPRKPDEDDARQTRTTATSS